MTGTWSGTWTSNDGTTGRVSVTVGQQNAGTIAGTLDITNTDCGNVAGIPFTGSVSGSVVAISATADCGADTGTLQYTQGVINGNTISGLYTLTVNGYWYDSGTWRVTRQ